MIDVKVVAENISSLLMYEIEIMKKTKASLAKGIGITSFRLDHLLDKKLDIKLDDVIKIATYFDMSVSELLDEEETYEEVSPKRHYRILGDVKECFSKAKDRQGLDHMYNLMHSFYENALIDAYDHQLDIIEPLEDLCVGEEIPEDKLIGIEELMVEDTTVQIRI